MSNMSYCRFENTYGDLKDCKNAVENQSELSEYELPYAKGMYKLCLEFIKEAEQYGLRDEDNNIHHIKS